MSASNTKNSSQTNWEKLDALTDADIDTSDIPPLTDAFFKRALSRIPRKPVSVTLQVDEDVLAWFKEQEGEYEQRINAALRLYVETHKAYCD